MYEKTRDLAIYKLTSCGLGVPARKAYLLDLAAQTQVVMLIFCCGSIELVPEYRLLACSGYLHRRFKLCTW